MTFDVDLACLFTLTASRSIRRSKS